MNTLLEIAALLATTPNPFGRRAVEAVFVTMETQDIVRLKVKIKNLADEARTIKHEERKALSWWKFRGENGQNAQYNLLRNHRLEVVRTEARASLLAYGFLQAAPSATSSLPARSLSTSTRYARWSRRRFAGTRSV